MQKTSSLTGANWLYLGILLGVVSLSGLIPLLGISSESTMAALLQTIVLEVVAIGLPAVVYIGVAVKDKKAVLKTRPLPFIDMILVGGMAFTGYGVVIFVNLVWYAILSRIGEPMTQEIPVITTPEEFLLGVAGLAIVPALCEELLFRGVMLHAYENRMRWVSAVILVGVMFAVYHLLLLTIPSIIILGVMITYVVWRTRSIWAGVLYHFIHNFLSLCLTYLQGYLFENMDPGALPGDITDLGGDALVAGIIAWAVIGAFCLGLFAIFTWLLHYRTRHIERPVRIQAKTTFGEWLPAALAGALILYLWVAQFIGMAAA